MPATLLEKRPAISLRERLGYLPLLLRAAVTTIELSVVAMALAVVVGLVMVLMRLYGSRRCAGWPKATSKSFVGRRCSFSCS